MLCKKTLTRTAFFLNLFQRNQCFLLLHWWNNIIFYNMFEIERNI